MSASSSSYLPANQHRDFTDAQLFDLVAIAFAFSLVSAVSSLFIIGTFAKFPRLHTFAYAIIMMLALANFFLDCAYLMGNVGHDNWKCTLQGWARVYFALVEFGLITAITLTCYLMIVKHRFSIREHFWTVMAYCWIIPLVMALLPFTTNSYGDAGAWCSITSKDLKSLMWGTVWRFAVIYIPLWVSVAVNAYMCFRIYQAIRGFEAAMVAYAEPTGAARAMEDSQRTEAAEDEAVSVVGGGIGGGRVGAVDSRGIEVSTSIPIVNRLRLYSIALVVCWSWATVNRVQEAINPYGSVFWLYVLQYSFQTIQGLLNLIIFLRTPSVMQQWVDESKKWRCCRRVTEIDHSSLLTSTSISDKPQ